VVEPSQYLRLFFSDPLHPKVWFASAAMLLACSSCSRPPPYYGRVGFLPQGRGVATVHRWSGRLAILITLPVAYHCIFLLGFGDYTTRVTVHSLLCSAIYGAVIAKVLIVRSGDRIPRPESQVAGVLFAILLGIWLTSSLIGSSKTLESACIALQRHRPSGGGGSASELLAIASPRGERDQRFESA
jgi:hypothetical protein